MEDHSVIAIQVILSDTDIALMSFFLIYSGALDKSVC